MDIVIKINKDISAAEAVKKVMAGKNAFGEAVRSGNIESFIKPECIT